MAIDDRTVDETASAFAKLYADKPAVLAKLLAQASAAAFASHDLIGLQFKAVDLQFKAMASQSARIAQLTAALIEAGVEAPPE